MYLSAIIKSYCHTPLLLGVGMGGEGKKQVETSTIQVQVFQSLLRGITPLSPPEGVGVAEDTLKRTSCPTER